MITSTHSKIAALLLSLTATFATGGVFADYRLTAFSDTLGFRALLNEDGAAAEAIFASRKIERMDYFEANNLCVTQILMEEYEAAITSCSSALEKADVSSELTIAEEKIALAAIYSNLAIAKALNGDAAGANLDLGTALSLNRKDDNASMNYDLITKNLLAGD